MKDPELDRGAISEVFVIVAPLDMSSGKALAQAFQAGALWTDRIKSSLSPITPYHVTKLFEVGEWFGQGTRTIVRFAKTPAIFDRVVREIPGFTMCDEGFTEVEEGAATIHVCGPHLHRDRPKLLNNKRLAEHP